MFLTASH
jgi:enamine deaminase RidA (YjgF/YER057c/UK114 family)